MGGSCKNETIRSGGDGHAEGKVLQASWDGLEEGCWMVDGGQVLSKREPPGKNQGTLHLNSLVSGLPGGVDSRP